MPVPTDLRGVPIREGDWVIWMCSGRYADPDLYQVSDVKKRVRLVDETGWVNSGSLIVVDSVPYVEGRTNTATKGTNE